MKIAISGTHSTGKSTLIAALKDEPNIRNRFGFVQSETRRVPGAVINEKGDDNSQRMFIAKEIENSTLDEVIFDRCALDRYCYTAYLYEKGRVSIETLKLAKEVFRLLKYDILFYIKPEFDIVEDGVRSTNVEFQKRVEAIFDEYIATYKIPHILLKGTVDERVKTILETLEKYDSQVNHLRLKIGADEQSLR